MNDFALIKLKSDTVCYSKTHNYGHMSKLSQTKAPSSFKKQGEFDVIGETSKFFADIKSPSSKPKSCIRYRNPVYVMSIPFIVFD